LREFSVQLSSSQCTKLYLVSDGRA
jgi:hypothetical protein